MSANEAEGEGPTMDVPCLRVEHLQTLDILKQPCRERLCVLLEIHVDIQIVGLDL
jgi:hypothetical protein